MRCVCWSADFSEARVVEAMFRAQGVPVDLVTASASGLDPNISRAAADYQAARVARSEARGGSP